MRALVARAAMRLGRQPPMKDTVREYGSRTTAAPRDRDQTGNHILVHNRRRRTRASGGRGNTQGLFDKTGEVASIPQKRPQTFIHVCSKPEE